MISVDNDDDFYIMTIMQVGKASGAANAAQDGA